MGVAERKEREKEQRRNAIIDAAEVIFFQKGIENATMDEVADKAELSKGTIYLYFKNKMDLFHGITARGLDILYNMFKNAANIEREGIEKIKGIGRAYNEFYKKYPDYYGSILHQSTHEYDPTAFEENPNIALCDEIGNKIFALIQECVEIGIRDKTVRHDLDAAKLPVILWGHSAGVLHVLKTKGQYLEEKLGCTVEDIINYAFELVIQYLEARHH